MLLRLLALARAVVELAEAEMAVGDEPTHAELSRNRECVAVICFGVRSARAALDLDKKMTRLGFLTTCASRTREFEAFLSCRRRVAWCIRPGMASGKRDPKLRPR